MNSKNINMFSKNKNTLSASNPYASLKQSVFRRSNSYKLTKMSTARRNTNKIYREYFIAVIENRAQEIGMAAYSTSTGKITLL